MGEKSSWGLIEEVAHIAAQRVSSKKIMSNHHRLYGCEKTISKPSNLSIG
jgi:hypothetical protein